MNSIISWTYYDYGVYGFRDLFDRFAFWEYARTRIIIANFVSAVVSFFRSVYHFCYRFIANNDFLYTRNTSRVRVEDLVERIRYRFC